MSGSVFGTIFTVTTWGESHGRAIGAVIDGCPAGLPLGESDIAPYTERRRPGRSALSTKRREDDRTEILSGVFDGKTTGAPISLLIRNSDQHSSDYDALLGVYRPGHADYTFDAKYGIRDHRGGGRSSARETAARVAAGAVAAKLLRMTGVTFESRVTAIGGIPFSDTEAVSALIADLREKGDSVGSEVECVIRGVPAGIGDPVFNKLDARLAGAMFSIGAVKAVDIGDGRQASKENGSSHNDPFCMENGRITKKTNHAGGILGGISDGSDINLHVFFKPTPSISLLQHTVRSDGTETGLEIHGRHDPVIAPRAAVVTEGMAALVLADSMLINMTARADSFIKFYADRSS